MRLTPLFRPSLPGLVAGLILAAPAPRLDAQTKEPQQAPPPAAKPAPEQEVETFAPTNVEVVRIEVVVTEKRRAKAGLLREDFAVLEDGKPQPIVQFQAFSRPSSETTVAAAPEPVATEADEEKEGLLPGRYVVLAIDDVHMGFESLVRTQKALARFINQDLAPEDQVALVITSGARALSQEFTTDRAVLRQTLSRLSVQERRAGWMGIPYLSEYQAELIEAGDPTALDAAVQEILASGIEQDLTAAEGIARTKARAITEEAIYNSRLVLESLESLCRGLSGVSGRKAIFLLSDGFLTGVTTNRSSAGFDVRRIADAATRAAVVIYSLDTRGLIASPPIASASSTTRGLISTAGNVEAMRHRSEEATREAMNALAADTGGFMTDNANDLRGGLHEMLKDTETYYVLAYEPTNTRRDGGFRKIEVRLPGLKGIKVRTRSGYFAPSDRRQRVASADAAQDEARRSEQRRAEMTAALHSLAPLNGIPVRLSADFMGKDDGTTQLVVSGNVDVAKLPFVRLKDRRQATLESVAVAFDESGDNAATLQTQRTAMDLGDADYERLLGAGIPYLKAVTLKPGRYQVRLAARDEATGLLGSAWQWIEIPEIAPGRFTLSSLFLLQEGHAPAVAPAPDAPDLHNAQAVRRYHRNESLYAQIYAYNPKKDADGATKLFAQAEILKNGQTLGKAAPEPMESGGAQAPPLPHTSRIRLQRFEPGNYELRMTVSDENANAIATRRVAFTVVE
jgi:VWFA-related protein